jgi:hypothetical protein
MTYWQLFWIAVGSVFTFVLLLLLLIRGSGYSVADTEAHAADYAGVIREGHGGITIFLWVLFISLFIWTIVYFAMHWHEFAIIWAYSQ